MFHPGPWPIDLSVSNIIQAWQPAWLTAVVKIISFITAPEFYFGFIAVAMIWLWRQNNKRQSLIVGGLLLGNALTPLLKWIFQRPRPSASLVHVYQHLGLFSFPSGHAIGIVILLVILYVLFRHILRRGQLPLLIVIGILAALFVGYCRIYLGVHWMTDVIAGYGIGFLWVGAVFWFEKRY